jgi:hypothetical protein
MRTKLIYRWSTTVGTFYIGQSEDGRFHPIYNDETYGSYSQAWQASEELAHNLIPIHHPTTGKRIDTSKLGIPDHTSDWERIRPMEGDR